MKCQNLLGWERTFGFFSMSAEVYSFISGLNKQFSSLKFETSYVYHYGHELCRKWIHSCDWIPEKAPLNFIFEEIERLSCGVFLSDRNRFSIRANLTGEDTCFSSSCQKYISQLLISIQRNDNVYLCIFAEKNLFSNFRQMIICHVTFVLKIDSIIELLRIFLLQSINWNDCTRIAMTQYLNRIHLFWTDYFCEPML